MSVSFSFPEMTLAEAIEALERRLIIRSIRLHRGNVSNSALALGITRQGLYKKIARLGIDLERYRNGIQSTG